MTHTLVKIYGRFGQNSCLRLQEDRKPPRLAARRVDRRVQPTSSQPDQNSAVCPIFKASCTASCTDWLLLFRCCLSFQPNIALLLASHVQTTWTATDTCPWTCYFAALFQLHSLLVNKLPKFIINRHVSAFISNPSSG